MKFNVSATVTISIYKEVEAKNRADALRIAKELTMPGLCYQCTRDDSEEPTWVVGDLDGEARNIEVSKS